MIAFLRILLLLVLEVQCCLRLLSDTKSKPHLTYMRLEVQTEDDAEIYANNPRLLGATRADDARILAV